MGRLRGVRVENAWWGRGLQKQRRTEAHTAPVINDLLGGQVDILCDQTTRTSSGLRQSLWNDVELEARETMRRPCFHAQGYQIRRNPFSPAAA